jgi:type I restriction enzyme, S subunit
MLPKGWKRTKLDGLLKEYVEKSTQQNQHEILTSSRDGLVKQSEYYGEGRILSRENIGYNVIPPNYMTYRSRSDDGDFFINRNTTGNHGIISYFYPVFHFPDGSSDFFYYFLNANRQLMAAHCVGSSQKVLSLNALLGIEFNLPSLGERLKIAEILLAWDKAIAVQEKLVANAKAHKKALMQQLLTGKKRLPGFKGEWKNTKLGQLGEFRKGRGISRAEVLADGIPCVRYGEVYTHHHDVIRGFNSFISERSAAESEEIACGDIIFTCSGETAEEIGKCVAFIGNHKAYAGGDTVIFTPRNCNSVFLSYLLNSQPVVAQKAQLGQGNSVVRISAANLAKLQFDVPETDEQRKIGDVVNSLDEELIHISAELYGFRKEKSALMQQLLTGKRRVRMESAA